MSCLSLLNRPLTLRLLACALLGVVGCSEGEEVSTSTTNFSSSGNSSGGTSITSAGSASSGGDTDTDTDGGPMCGDGVVDDGEKCDEGEGNAPDGACTPDCTLATCGDGYVGPGEECDDGEDNADDAACLTTCVAAACGDGYLEKGAEECDDGNDDDKDGCTNDCVIKLCGNGDKDDGEACDDGNDDDSDACLSTCQEASCGDGFVHEGEEECDDGDANGLSGACLPTCVAATCGDGHVQEGVEECDDGPGNGDTAACLPDCVAATCGDGLVNEGVEECDDGNTDAGDGCSDACELELACGETFTTEWCLQSGTKSQYTRCEQVTDGGLTCKNPEIRYGDVEGGIPRSHPNGQTYYPLWCQQLGFDGFSAVGFGLRDCAAPKGSLFPCNNYDENGVWHWCDWADGYWYNELLEKHNCDGSEIISVTCTKG